MPKARFSEVVRRQKPKSRNGSQAARSHDRGNCVAPRPPVVSRSTSDFERAKVRASTPGRSRRGRAGCAGARCNVQPCDERTVGETRKRERDRQRRQRSENAELIARIENLSRLLGRQGTKNRQKKKDVGTMQGWFAADVHASYKSCHPEHSEGTSPSSGLDFSGRVLRSYA